MKTVGNVVGRLVVSASLILTAFMGRDLRAQFSGNNQTNVISGVTSNWVGGAYFVGSDTFLDSLQILSGGVLSNGDGYVGYTSGGSNNSVLVSGTGSIWSNMSSLTVGNAGSGNGVTITNGGAVYSSGGCTLGSSSFSSNNLMLVTGTNSLCRGGEVNVGLSGPGNQLIIANGGAVYGEDGRIGVSNSANNNQVVVTGPGSVFSNNAGMYVAFSGWGNQLTITNGGAVIGNYISYIGYDVHSSNNVATVSGAGSVWNILGGIGDLYLGEQGPQNRLTITNGGAVYDNGGFIGAAGSASSNIVTVTGTGSIWSNRANLTVGVGAGVGSQLIISGGGAVFDNTGTINHNSFGSSNLVTVIGSGSVWSNHNDVYVGGGGFGNALTLTGGGKAYDVTGFIGYTVSSSNNTVFVGDGSLWNNSGNLHVGYNGSNNRLLFAPKGTVIASNAYIGFNPGSANNQIVLGGLLFVTNADHNAVLDIRCGQLVLSGGVLQVDILIITNACGHLVHNGGQLTYSQLILDPDLDADGDGIPNGWEQASGLDPLSTNGVNGANGDPDGDGLTNLQEFLAGTDPTNSASAFQITAIAREGNDVRVTWMMGSDKTNALQRTAGDAAGGYGTNSFTDIFTVTNTVGTATNHLDVGAATHVPSLYYRVRLIP